MDVTTVELFTAMLSVIAIVGSVVYAISCAFGLGIGGLTSTVHRLAPALAAAVAVVATAGSLYFSEVADYVPCRLCWFQRICMYPLVAILVVGAVLRDRNVRWYALPLAVSGAAVSAYHYIIEWKPSLGEGACGIGPSCTDVWFRRMGFVTLAFMALCGFVSILLLVFVRPRDVQVVDQGEV